MGLDRLNMVGSRDLQRFFWNGDGVTGNAKMVTQIHTISHFFTTRSHLSAGFSFLTVTPAAGPIPTQRGLWASPSHPDLLSGPMPKTLTHTPVLTVPPIPNLSILTVLVRLLRSSS